MPYLKFLVLCFKDLISTDKEASAPSPTCPFFFHYIYSITLQASTFVISYHHTHKPNPPPSTSNSSFPLPHAPMIELLILPVFNDSTPLSLLFLSAINTPHPPPAPITSAGIHDEARESGSASIRTTSNRTNSDRTACFSHFSSSFLQPLLNLNSILQDPFQLRLSFTGASISQL